MLDKILLLIIIQILPTILYYIIVTYLKEVHNEEKEIIYSILNVTILYLLIKTNNTIIPIYLIPIVLSYNKGKYKDGLLLSTILIIYLKSPIVIFSLGIMYLFKENKIITNLIPILLFKEKNLDILIYLFVLTIDNIIINLSEEVLSFHEDYKKLLAQEQITTSLFKITHEIKNPLAVCIGYLNMLDNANIEKYQKYTKIIKSEIERSLLILNDFSNLSKIKITTDIMDINMLLEDIIDKTKILLINKKIALKLIQKQDKIYIDGDYNRLSQVFINIIKNSVEAIEKEGHIIIEAKENNNQAIITIKDDGVGIKEGILKEITKPFFTTKEKGTGLGIPLSIEIIKKHNGKLKIESKEHIGTTIAITLPIKKIS